MNQPTEGVTGSNKASNFAYGNRALIVARLNEEFVRLFQDPKFASFLEKQSVVAAPTTPGDFVKFIREDRKAAQGLIRDAKTPKMEYRQ